MPRKDWWSMASSRGFEALTRPGRARNLNAHQSPGYRRHEMVSRTEQHPSRDTSRRKAPVYQVLAEDMKSMGIEAIFSLISDDTALLATALDTAGVRFYGAQHENTEIAMAEA